MKKFLTIMCSLVLCIVTLTGCNLVELDKEKYYNQIVAEVNSQDKAYVREYTKKELIEAFYQYTYQNVQNGSMTAEEGVNSAFNSMVERGLLIAGIKKEYIDTGKLSFTEEHEKQIRDEAFDYIQEEIFKFEDEIREERGMTSENDQTVTEEEAEESLRAEYKKYEPTIVFDFELNSAVRNEELNQNTVLGYDVPAHFTQKITDEAISREAYVRYIDSLQATAKAEGRDTAEDKVLEYEENRLIRLSTENKYLELFQEYLKNNNIYTILEGQDGQKDVYVVKEDITTQVEDYFEREYINQYNLYKNNVSAYREAMNSDASKVYYHPNSGEEFMYVSHILLKFSDTQTKKVEQLKAKLEKKQISQAEYDVQVKNIANNIQVVYEKEGETYTSNAVSVYKTVTDYVNNYGGNDPKKRAEKFNDMIYMFNDDEGIMNKDFAYVVNLKTEENGKEIEDKMVKPFANASRELNSNPEKGVGSISDMVITEYGVHIIFHAGVVENLIDPNVVINGSGIDYKILFKHTTQLSSNKTLFNYIYDSLSLENYSSRVSGFVSQIKGNVEIKKHKYAFKDLYE